MAGIAGNDLDYSPLNPSPCSTSETSNITSVRNMSPSKSLVSPSNISSQSISDSKTAPKSNLNYVAYPITKKQLALLLANDLQQRRKTNKSIDQRLIDDEKTFQDIEYKLNEKIKKYQERNIRKIQNSSDHKQQTKQIDIQHINELLDRIIDLDGETSQIKKEIRKKKWYQDRNALYRKISENNALMTEIDNMTQKIDYWQQMIVVTGNNNENNHNHNDKNIDINIQMNHGSHHNITPFVVKEALRIKSENEKTLNDLRAQLDEIRAKRI